MKKVFKWRLNYRLVSECGAISGKTGCEMASSLKNKFLIFANPTDATQIAFAWRPTKHGSATGATHKYAGTSFYNTNHFLLCKT